MHSYLPDGFIIFMIGIKRQFIPHPQSDKHSHRHSHSQPADIDQGSNPVLNKITPRDFQIVLYHGSIGLLVIDH
jgi:hypothetical protein